MFDGATQLVHPARRLCDNAERPAALELRRAHRKTDESVVGLLCDARDRPRQDRDEALEADCDGAELYRRSKQRPAARQQHTTVHALEVRESLTTVMGPSDAASIRLERQLRVRRPSEQRPSTHPLDVLQCRDNSTDKHHD